MKAYRDVRGKVPFIDLCKSPELVTQVTVAAAQRLGADAAILFSDLLLILEPMGMGLEYSTGEGPILTGRLAGRADVERLREVKPEESMPFVFDSIRMLRQALPESLPLIGFAGAPFTLAAYMIEGGSSRQFTDTKRFLWSDAGAWHALMEKISRALIAYVNAQIAAGADAVQFFDSWVGCLSPSDYRQFVLPHTQAVIRSVTPGVPVIHFGTGTGAFLNELREAGGDVIGVDFRVELDEAWRRIGYDRGIQGNLDPAILAAPLDVIRSQVRRILDQAGGRSGHIFNLGHGILPDTPEDHAVALVDMVHELSRR
jgi:uroporphyrinogen decarboxylase